MKNKGLRMDPWRSHGVFVFQRTENNLCSVDEELNIFITASDTSIVYILLVGDCVRHLQNPAMK
jgi:hypothetical protein